MKCKKKGHVFVIQNNIGNQKSGNTIVAPITHDDSKFPFLVPFTIQKDGNEAQDFIKKLKEITETATNEELEEIIIKNLTE